MKDYIVVTGDAVSFQSELNEYSRMGYSVLGGHTAIWIKDNMNDFIFYSAILISPEKTTQNLSNVYNVAAQTIEELEN